MKIGNRELGVTPYIIAEFGANSNGDLNKAKEAARIAKECGADAIKYQTYQASDLVVKGTPKFWEFEKDTHHDQYEAYEDIKMLRKEDYPELMRYCEEIGIEFLSTPFSFESADYLDALGMKAFKVASSDMSTLPYLEYIAKFRKPILLSTGASTLEEIKEAVSTIERTGNKQIIILHCTLCYPTKDEDANLNIIDTLSNEFPEYPIGVSDHTLGSLPSIVAITCGACVVEKHFTLDKTLTDTADHWLSVDPKELKEIVDGGKRVLALAGTTEKQIFQCERDTRKYDKRSIVSKVDIPKGTFISKEMLTYKRPGTGIWPKETSRLIGCIANEDIKADTLISWSMLG